MWCFHVHITVYVPDKEGVYILEYIELLNNVKYQKVKAAGPKHTQ